MQVDFYSKVLGMETSMNVIIPQNITSNTDADFPTLYLLHGMGDNHSTWLRRTSVERYAAKKNIAVVMPAAQVAWYTDMECGYKNYFTFISKELPGICRAFFPRMSAKREETWIAGISMGGYGALKTALWESDTFGRAAGLSGAYCIETRESDRYWNGIFGEPGNRTKHTVEYAAERLVSEGRLKPEIYIVCGTEDHHIECNRTMQNTLTDMGFDVTYKEPPGGHTWEFWDKEIQHFLDWLVK